jgi:hypothetical protein
MNKNKTKKRISNKSDSSEGVLTKSKMALFEKISKEMDAGDFYGPFTNLEDLFKHLKS